MKGNRNQQTTEEQPISPVLTKKMKSKDERQEKIKVVVRCRPLNKKGKSENFGYTFTTFFSFSKNAQSLSKTVK